MYNRRTILIHLFNIFHSVKTKSKRGEGSNPSPLSLSKKVTFWWPFSRIERENAV